MDENSNTSAAEEDNKAAVISDSEGDEDEGMNENFDGSPDITLPPEVWAAVINCEYCCNILLIYTVHVFILIYHLYPLDRPPIRFAHIMCINFKIYAT